MKYIDKFIELKKTSEDYWKNISIKKGVYGFQIQNGTKWNDGLSESQLVEFQKIMGFEFPEILKDFYTVMNGVDKEQINIYGNSSHKHSYLKKFYGFPDDVEEIKKLIKWIYEANKIDEEEMIDKNISRIFPIYHHRFILINQKEHPVLSIYGDDIVLYANNMIDLFYDDLEIKKTRLNYKEKINYWLD
ncbi:MAG: hypothetical protein LBG67_03310 [Campylobacteraceae bacterium]|jgi:hypothetical protein|nr:hypothetical protein [Campylobacteraceae bacterium]